MPRKKQDQSIDESHEKFKPHMLKLAQWLKRTIEQHDENVNAFVKKAQSRDHWSLPSSTFYQICRAQAVMSPDTAKKAAYWLKRLYGVKVDYTDLLNMIEDSQPADEPPPKVEREILPPSTLDWHLKRLPTEERIRIWPSILAQAGKDFQNQASSPAKVLPVGRRPAIDFVRDLINTEADRRRIQDTEEFAKQMLQDNCPERVQLAILALHLILSERRWPYQNSPEYEVCIGDLARFLGHETAEELQSYCGLIAQNSP